MKVVTSFFPCRWKQCLWASPVSGEIDSQDDHDVAEDPLSFGGMGIDLEL